MSVSTPRSNSSSTRSNSSSKENMERYNSLIVSDIETPCVRNDLINENDTMKNENNENNGGIRINGDVNNVLNIPNDFVDDINIDFNELSCKEFDPLECHTFSQTILNASVASHAAYSKDPQKFIENSKLNHSLFFAKQSCDRSKIPSEKYPYIVCASKNLNNKGGTTYYIAFRGVRSLKDLLLDLASIPEGLSNSNNNNNTNINNNSGITTQFGLNLKISSFDVRNVLPYLDENSLDEVIFTGHSLGGSTAVMLCQELFKNDYVNSTINWERICQIQNKFKCITFGSPQIGNKEFVDYLKSHFGNKSGQSIFKQNFIQIVNGKDIVPKILTMLINYVLLKPKSDPIPKHIMTLIFNINLIDDQASEGNIKISLSGINQIFGTALYVISLYCSSQLLVGCGSIFEIVETESSLPLPLSLNSNSQILSQNTSQSSSNTFLRWCGAAQAQSVIGVIPYDNFIDVPGAIQAHNMDCYCETLNRAFSFCLHPQKENLFRFLPFFLQPELIRENSELIRNGRDYQLHFTGKNILWLKFIRFHCLNMMNDFIILQGSYANGKEYCKGSIKLPLQINPLRPPSLMTIDFFGLFGDFSCDFPVVDTSTDKFFMGELERKVYNDGRFTDMDIFQLIDTSLFRVSLFSHAASRPFAGRVKAPKKSKKSVKNQLVGDESLSNENLKSLKKLEKVEKKEMEENIKNDEEDDLVRDVNDWVKISNVVAGNLLRCSQPLLIITPCILRNVLISTRGDLQVRENRIRYYSKVRELSESFLSYGLHDTGISLSVPQSNADDISEEEKEMNEEMKEDPSKVSSLLKTKSSDNSGSFIGKMTMFSKLMILYLTHFAINFLYIQQLGLLLMASRLSDEEILDSNETRVQQEMIDMHKFFTCNQNPETIMTRVINESKYDAEAVQSKKTFGNSTNSVIPDSLIIARTYCRSSLLERDFRLKFKSESKLFQGIGAAFLNAVYSSSVSILKTAAIVPLVGLYFVEKASRGYNLLGNQLSGWLYNILRTLVSKNTIPGVPPSPDLVREELITLGLNLDNELRIFCLSGHLINQIFIEKNFHQFNHYRVDETYRAQLEEACCSMTGITEHRSKTTYALECEINQHLTEKHMKHLLYKKIKRIDQDSDVSSPDADDFKSVLHDDVILDNSLDYVRFLRASQMLHDLRLHVSSTYVIVVVGMRGHGKSTLVKHVFGFDATCGSEPTDSTKDVNPYYFRLEGDGLIKHLLVLDTPGSDEVVAHSSLYSSDGFSIADLVIVVNKQARASSTESISLLSGLISTSGTIQKVDLPNINNTSNLEKKSDNKNTVVDDSVDKSAMKVIFLMTHADEQLRKVFADLEDSEDEDEESNSDESDEDEGEKATHDKIQYAQKAREVAQMEWKQVKDSLEKNLSEKQQSYNPSAVNNIVVASCAIGPSAKQNKRDSSIKTCFDEGAILDQSNLKAFLKKCVPVEVGNWLDRK